MNVASLKLSKALFESSGWDDTQKVWVLVGGEILGYDERHGRGGLHNNMGPVYELGYLLRKLPYNSVVMHHEESLGWIAENSLHGVHGIVEATPEDAAAKLCIHLIKEGLIDVGEKR